MAFPAEGPCSPWTEWDAVGVCCDRDLVSIDDEVQQELLIGSASDILYNLSWRQFPGECTAARSFCLECGPQCARGCRCRRSKLSLGSKFAVASVERVTIDGIDLAADEYRVDDWGDLIRLDGTAWPRAVDLNDPESFEVEWTYGRPVPPGGQLAAGRLVCELAQLCIPGATCNLPARITGVTREGVTYTLVDPQSIIERGSTGLTDVDLWVWTVTTGATDHEGGMFDPGAHGHMIATDTG